MTRVVRVPGGAVPAASSRDQGILPGGRWSAPPSVVTITTDQGGAGVVTKVGDEHTRAAQDVPVPWAVAAGGSVDAGWAAGAVVTVVVEAGTDVGVTTSEYTYAVSTVPTSTIVATIVARWVRVVIARIVAPNGPPSSSASASVWATVAPWEWRA
jgi:hypothetical protein